VGLPLPPVDAARLDRELAQLRSTLEPVVLDALQTRGSELFPAEIVAMALAT
jgi:hypothetical protein